MASRRHYLALITIGGVAGCTGTAERISSSVGPPPTETQIGSHSGSTRSLVNRIEFYESGAAIIYPTSDHGCYDAMALTHELTTLPMGDNGLSVDDALTTIELGDFDEPITFDMAGAIATRSNYPDTNFRLRSYSKEGACFAVTIDRSETFQVPMDYLPSN